MLKSKIISIGDEILIGQIVNSNAAFIGEKLFAAGIPVERIVTIGDTEQALVDELDDSIKNFDATVITGGLGPTHDDITKPVIVKYFNDELITDERVLEKVKSIFKSRNVKMPDVNFEQAKVPASCRVIYNENGTAPGMWMERKNRVIICLPGVPYEMKEMILNSVLPMLKEKFGSKTNYVLKTRTLLTTGIGESNLSEMLGPIGDIIGQHKLAFLPSTFGVRMRIDVKGENEETADGILDEIERKIRNRTGDYIYGTDEDLLEKITGDLLNKKKLTLSVAESCTGGLLSSKITDISGSSAYFLGGVCSYSNESKTNLLNVSKDTIDKFGAVSEETAVEMAVNVRRKFGSDFGISITGIAGPTGGTDIKPVGLVWIALSSEKRTIARKYLFGNNRERTKIRASYQALLMLKSGISE